MPVEEGPDLTPAQELEQEYCDVFSTKSGWTTLVQHHIHTLSGTVIRQWPYHMLEARHQAIKVKLAHITGWDHQGVC